MHAQDRGRQASLTPRLWADACFSPSQLLTAAAGPQRSVAHTRLVPTAAATVARRSPRLPVFILCSLFLKERRSYGIKGPPCSNVTSS